MRNISSVLSTTLSENHKYEFFLSLCSCCILCKNILQKIQVEQKLHIGKLMLQLVNSKFHLFYCFVVELVSHWLDAMFVPW